MMATARLEAYGFDNLPRDPTGRRHWAKTAYVDPDLAVPGQGEPKSGCGDFYTAYCSNDATHPTERGLHQCGNRNCPNCATNRGPIRIPIDDEDHYHYHCGCSTDASGEVTVFVRCHRHADPGDDIAQPEFPQRGAWLAKLVRGTCGRIDYAFRKLGQRLTPDGNGRLDSDGHRMDLRQVRIYHVVVSPPPRAWGYTRPEEKEVRKKVRKILRERGLVDFQMWMHAYRHDGTEETKAMAYNKLGLHYHVLAVSRWAMMGQPKRAVRGRPPKTTEAQTRYHFDGAKWTPLKSRREPLEGWVWKVIWFAQPAGRGFMLKNLEKGRITMKTSVGFACYLARVVEYLFHLEWAAVCRSCPWKAEDAYGESLEDQVDGHLEAFPGHKGSIIRYGPPIPGVGGEPRAE